MTVCKCLNDFLLWSLLPLLVLTVVGIQIPNIVNMLRSKTRTDSEEGPWRWSDGTQCLTFALLATSAIFLVPDVVPFPVMISMISANLVAIVLMAHILVSQKGPICTATRLTLDGSGVLLASISTAFSVYFTWLARC